MFINTKNLQLKNLTKNVEKVSKVGKCTLHTHIMHAILYNRAAVLGYISPKKKFNFAIKLKINIAIAL